MSVAQNIDPDDYLKGNRGHVYAAIQEEPGIHFRGLVRKLDIASGTINHHVRVLERLGYVKCFPSGPYLRYVARGDDPACATEAYQLRQEPLTQDILRLVEENPGLNQKELTQRYGALPRSTMQHRLARYAALGMVRQSTGRGRARRYWPPAESKSPRDLLDGLMARRARPGFDTCGSRGCSI